MRKVHLSLVQQLGQLETRQCEIADGITEVERRIGILDEVMSWSIPEPLTDQDFYQEDHSQEAIFQEEFAEEEMFREELPQVEMFQEELPEEESSEEESLKEEVFQVSNFRQLDTEGTEIQWVNR